MSESLVERRIGDLGLSLPEVAPTHEFLAVKLVGDLCYISGHAPYRDGGFRFQGKVGVDLDVDTGRRAAELATLGCLASLRAVIGDLGAVDAVVKVNGYVNCAPSFGDLPAVTDAASRLLIAVFGESGRHARTTVGVASLPAGVAVEVEMTVKLEGSLQRPGRGGATPRSD